ncbi:hypothetical protein ACEQPO_21190 [Bacillus sp. SL00103]
MVSTSEIKVSTVVGRDDMVKAVEALHDAFELSKVGAILKTKKEVYLMKECTSFYIRNRRIQERKNVRKPIH